MTWTDTAPGKVFLLGEYAVLAGLPALVAALEPRFRMSARERGIGEGESGVATPAAEAYSGFHPQSPVARLQDYAHNASGPELVLEFDDPFRGEGGFGASTAQFALGYAAYAQRLGWELEWKRVWKLYRELTSSGERAVPPSGADLVAQFLGGVALFDPSKLKHEDLGPLFDWSSLLVFSATSQVGRKVETHRHLENLKASGLLEEGTASPLATDLKHWFNKGLKGIRARDVAALGEAMDEYGNALARHGLEIEATRRDRQALRTLPGVFGVKGAGAYQADSVLVLVQPMELDPASRLNRQRVIEVATQRGLRLVADGLVLQKGVACPN